ncbi:hypothetical protein SDC9_112411 [bioreactor metagenome]|uniref:NAD-specific glutamate dehydrogenase n=1 Tax=bioreactor metagenome TaxID=1076179 RepID=A0A645BUQ4_9ZZZZ
MATGASSQLVVDASGLVALGTQDVESPKFFHFLVVSLPGRVGLLDGNCHLLTACIAAADSSGSRIEAASQLDVRSAPSHVGGDRHRSLGAGFLDDHSLTGVVLCIEHLMADPHLAQQHGEHLTLFDADGTHEYRLADFVHPLNLLADCLELELFVVVDEVGMVFSHHRFVGGDDHDIEIVDFQEFRCFGVCGTGHAADLVIHPEEVLEGDGGQRLVLSQDLDLLLGLNGLVQTVAVAPSMQDAPGEFVDYLDLSVDNHVVDIMMVEPEGTHRLGHIVHILKVLVGIDGAVYDLLLVQQFFHVLQALVGETDFLLLLIQLVVAPFLEGRSIPVKACKGVLFVVIPGFRVFLALGEKSSDLLCAHDLGRIILALAADDQGGSGLIDQDRVDLVDDAVVVLGLDLLILRPLHVVSQIIEAELIVCSVGDILAVSGSFRLIVHIRENRSHR